jgi:hypothetical protein
MNRVELEKKIKQSIHELIYEKKHVSSVDLLMKLDYLSKTDYEKWRQGKIGYLEKACKANLGKLSFINKSLRIMSKELDLKASWTAYMKYGKQSKDRLRFSKSNTKSIEKEYSTHYVLKKEKTNAQY